MARLLRLAALLSLLLCAAAQVEPAHKERDALRPIKLAADTLDETLASLDPQSYMLVELFACAPGRGRRACAATAP